MFSAPFDDEEMLTALAEKCDASSAVTATLTAAGWASGQQTLTIAGLGATQNGVIGLSQSITDEQLSAASEAEMYICGQAAGSVTIAGKWVCTHLRYSSRCYPAWLKGWCSK